MKEVTVIQTEDGKLFALDQREQAAEHEKNVKFLNWYRTSQLWSEGSANEGDIKVAGEEVLAWLLRHKEAIKTLLA